MSPAQLLPGVTQLKVKTDRLEMAYLEAGIGSAPIVLLHGNASASPFFQDFMLALATTNRYKVYAPDMRGYGDSEGIAVDAARGLQDFSDDLDSFARTLGLNSFHLLGWSLGGNIAMQYAIDHPGTLRSLTLESPGSPFGFGGTKNPEGTPTWPDFSGSGGGTANPSFVQLIAQGDRGNEQFSPRTVMNNFYFKPPFRATPDREEIYVSAILSTRVGAENYPGDMTPSDNWPTLAPGTQGVNNALSPKYMNQANFATITIKPPVLWIHGADDQIVSDTSLFDFGFLGQIGAVPGWPGMDIYPPQPMKVQIRVVLNDYVAKGGEYREVELPDCGHSPHIEKQEEMLKLFTEFVDAHVL